jgi:hypothetical protein
MSIEKLQSHWGFTVMPFRRNLPVASLHRFRAHAEAAARIRWLIDQHAFGVLTGEVGAGMLTDTRSRGPWCRCRPRAPACAPPPPRRPGRPSPSPGGH